MPLLEIGTPQNCFNSATLEGFQARTACLKGHAKPSQYDLSPDFDQATTKP